MLAAGRSVGRSALRVRTAGRVLRTSATAGGAARVARPPTAGVASSAVRAGLATTGRLYGGPVRTGPYTGPGDAARGAESALSAAPSGPHADLRLRGRRARRALPALRRRPGPAGARRRLPVRGADAGEPRGGPRRPDRPPPHSPQRSRPALAPGPKRPTPG